MLLWGAYGNKLKTDYEHVLSFSQTDLQVLMTIVKLK
jgi:hypothetical protein